MPDNRKGQAARPLLFTVKEAADHENKIYTSSCVAPALVAFLSGKPVLRKSIGFSLSVPWQRVRDILKPAPFVFTVAGNQRARAAMTCRTLESVLIAVGYRVGVCSSLIWHVTTERARAGKALRRIRAYRALRK